MLQEASLGNTDVLEWAQDLESVKYSNFKIKYKRRGRPAHQER